jgi:hypothetical protein
VDTGPGLLSSAQADNLAGMQGWAELWLEYLEP